MDGTNREDVRVELAVRSLGPTGRQSHQDAAIERLEALESRGAIADFDVSVWGKRVGLDDASAGTRPARKILSTVETFEGWAERNDYAIGPFFETKRIRSELTGEDYRALELPTMTLAEYRGDELEWVSPCLDPATDTTYTVQDRIEALEAEGADHARNVRTVPPQAVPEE